MPRIGPYSFATMDGRVLTSSQPTVATARGVRPAPPRPHVAEMRTTEAHTSHAAAWIQALTYRQAIGLIVDVEDADSLYCSAAVIVDVRTRVDHASTGGATLVTTWSIAAGIQHGAVGQPILAPPSAPATTTEPPPSPIVIPAAATFAVAGYAVDAIAGDLQWWLPQDAAARVQSALRAVGYPDASLSPSDDGGSIVVWKHQASTGDCFIASDAMRLLVGTYATVTIAGIQIDVAVRDATADWGEGRGLPSGMTHWWTASLTCGVDQQPGGGDDPNAPTDCVVETATQWGAWARLADAVCDDASEGLGPSVGGATIRIDLSPTLRAGRVHSAGLVDYTGRWVRIRVRKSEPRAQRGQVGDPIWWGRILASSTTAGAGQPATQTLTAAGIGVSLQQIEPHRWYAVGQVEAHDPGQVLPVNQIPRGDRADGTTAFREHDAAGAAGDRWTARDLVECILDSVRQTYPGGPAWQLGGQVDALSYVLEPQDLRGRTALEMLDAAINPRHGTTFRLEIDSSTGAATVRVNTTVRDALTVAGLDIDLRANDRLIVSTHPTTGAALAHLDLDRPEIPGLEIRTDRGAEIDILHIEGGTPWLMVTLGFKDGTADAEKYSLIKGWTATEETAWDSASFDQRNQPHLAHVWRRFALRDAYKGTGYFHAGGNRVARVTRTTATDATHGSGGETGAVTGTVGDPTLPVGRNYRFTRDLPIWEGKDWTATITASAIEENSRFDRQVRAPMAWTRDGSGTYRAIHDRMQIQVDDQAAAIVLGRDAADAEELRSLLASTTTALDLLVTVGIEAPQPWRCSWRRDDANRPASQSRSLTLRYPDMAWRGVCSGTMIGIKPDGTAQQVDTDGAEVALLGFGLPNAPETARIVALLRLARLWYDAPHKSITWSQAGAIDATAATAPGSLVGDVRWRVDRSRVDTTTINAVVTGRRWSFRRGDLVTTWQAERLKIDGAFRIAAAAPALAPMLPPIGRGGNYQ